MRLPCSTGATESRLFDAIHDSWSCHRIGQPVRLTRRRTPIRSAISRSFARLAAKKRPTKRSPRSCSIPCCQRWALKPSRSKIPASSSEIEAFPWRKAIKSHAKPQRRKRIYAQEIVESISITPSRLLETFRLFLLLFGSFAALRLCVRSPAYPPPRIHRRLQPSSFRLVLQPVLEPLLRLPST